MLGRGVLIVIVLVGVADADDARVADPAQGPAFVNVMRLDAGSRIGLEYTQSDQVAAKPIHRVALHAHYVEPSLRVGGYVDLPYTMHRYDALAPKETHFRDVFGHLELGALWVPRIPSRYVALVVHAGVALPLEKLDWDDYPWDLAARAELVRPHDIYAGFAETTTPRFGVSALFRKGVMFSRVDVGYEANLTSDRFPDRITSVHANAAIGAASSQGVSFGLELSTITRVSDTPYQQPEVFQFEAYDDTNMLGALAMSLRYRRGHVQLYGAIITTLRPPQERYVRGGVTAGFEYSL